MHLLPCFILEPLVGLISEKPAGGSLSRLFYIFHLKANFR
jgi:hypothetical protein